MKFKNMKLFRRKYPNLEMLKEVPEAAYNFPLDTLSSNSMEWLCLCFILTENYRLLDDSQTGAQNYIATFISIKPTKITAIKNQAASEQKISVYSGDK